MSDRDLIARVYPVLHASERAINAIKASPHCVPPQIQRSTQAQPERHDREGTEPPEDSSQPPHLYLPCVELRFSKTPRTSRGLVFGFNSNNSDVVLPLYSITHCHFSLKFDDERGYLVVRDWGSLAGTEVTYDNEGSGRRRNFQWVIGGHNILRKKKSVIITVHETLSFQVFVAHHDFAYGEYDDQIDRFRRGSATAEELFGGISLPGRETRRQTGAHTPGVGAIHLTKNLGEGSFGVVTHYWNVSDGSEYALKEPSTRAIRRRTVDVDAWKKEARIMGRLAHPHIVRLLDFIETPQPRLFLQYAGEGSLDGHENILSDEVASILSQCLSALSYLHGSQPPIVHRDIKPGNILVQHRYPDNIYVQFGDFGLSRDSCDLQTICGTQLYLAPEIYLSSQGISFGHKPMKYTPAVDVWSLGVVAYELLCDLPPYKEEYVNGGAAWCETVAQKFEKDQKQSPGEIKSFLMEAMVLTAPESRWSAKRSYEQAKLLPGGADSSMPNPRPVTLLDVVVEDRQSGVKETVLWKPDFRDNEHPNGTIDTDRSKRSGAPPPSFLVPSSKAVRKRADRTSSPSSSAGRQGKRREPRRHSDRASPRQEPELEYFQDEYSQDPLNPLFVGSSIAYDPGPVEEASEDWSSQSSHSPVAKAQTGNASTKAEPPENSSFSLPKWDLPQSHFNDIPPVEGDGHAVQNSFIGLEGTHDDEETLAAAVLLNAMGRRAPGLHSP